MTALLKINVKKIAFGNKEHTTDKKMGVSVVLTPKDPKEMKYNLHYGKVRGDILPPPHGTNTGCSVNVKKIAFRNKEHITD